MALTSMNTGGSVTYTVGCGVTSNDTSGIQAAVQAAEQADVVVLVVGIDTSVEAEGHDRTSLDLPGAQHQLIAAVAKVGKPTVLFLVHGGPIDISPELNNGNIATIVDVGYPGFLGGVVLAQTTLGENDRLGGKLAMMVYPTNYVTMMPMSEMEMDEPPGRGYRFYNGPLVLPFGYGLSLASFDIRVVSTPTDPSLTTEVFPSKTLTYTLTITNNGTITGDEVIQLYMIPLVIPSDLGSRLEMQLLGYRRVHLVPQESVDISFSVTSESLRVVDRWTGDTVSTHGSFQLLFSNGVSWGMNYEVDIVGKEIIVGQYPF
jgi:beta-D-xylosidase 4